MKRALISVVSFPLDLIYFTFDAAVVSFRFVQRRLKKEKLQKSHFCEGEDREESPHVVRSVLKYQNTWLVKLLAPCITFKRDAQRQIGFCKCDHGYYKAPGYVPLIFVGVVGLWGFLIFGSLRAVSSDPDNFGRNFISTFNPSSLAESEEDADFLVMGEARLNPEKANRYYLSGIKYLDQRKFANAQVDLKIAIQSNPTDPELHFALARAFFGTGQRVQGESSLRRTLELDEDYVEALLLLSELVQSQEKAQEAYQLASRALELEPENLRAIRLNAGLLANRGNQEEARILMDQLFELDGDNPDTLAFLGRLEIALFKDTEAAAERIDKALAQNPDHIPAKLVQVNLYAQDQNVAMVDQTLAEIITLDPENMQAHRIQAELDLNRYGLPAGIRAYQQLLTRFAGNLQFRLRYAELLFRAGQISEAKNIAEQLTSSRVTGIERSAHWMLAQLYAQVRMFEDAIEHAQSTLRLSPGARGIHLFLAQNYLNLNRFAEAKREAESALAINREDLQAINLLTQSMVRMGQEAEAVDYLEQLLAENPDQDGLKMRKIEILMQTSSWPEALDDSEALLEKYPDNPTLINNMAFLLARSETELDRAYALIQSLPEEISQQPVILDTRAYILAAQGKHEEALALYEEALASAGGNVLIRFHYAKSLSAVGRESDAVNQLKAVLSINPDFPQAEDASSLLQSLTSTGA